MTDDEDQRRWDEFARVAWREEHPVEWERQRVRRALLGWLVLALVALAALWALAQFEDGREMDSASARKAAPASTCRGTGGDGGRAGGGRCRG